MHDTQQTEENVGGSGVLDADYLNHVLTTFLSRPQLRDVLYRGRSEEEWFLSSVFSLINLDNPFQFDPLDLPQMFDPSPTVTATLEAGDGWSLQGICIWLREFCDEVSAQDLLTGNFPIGELANSLRP